MPSSVSAPGRIGFAGFVFDPAGARLLHAGESIAMRPKLVALLVELTARAGDLVDKDELMRVVWPETAVTDSVLAGAVRDLRRVLGDDPRRPRVIETVHRRGYRFIAALEAHPVSGSETPQRAAAAIPAAEPAIVGRRDELEILTKWLETALGGEAVIGFVVGEAGMGKTTLVSAFRERAAAAVPRLRIGTGYGVEWTSDDGGSVDPYVPIIEALSQACTGPGGDSTIAAIRRYAPSWLALLPGVLDPDEAETERTSFRRTTRERLALELTGFLDALPHPLLLLLEDLHWSDASTLDLLTAIARRSLRAPLLVLATYRAAGAAARRHPVRAAHQTLAARGSSRDLWLRPFDAVDVECFLQRRWPMMESAAAGIVARVVLARTDGNPLFVASVIDTLESTSFIGVETDRLESAAAELAVRIPPGLGQMIDVEMGRLGAEDRQLLEAGSLSGTRFSADSVAAASAIDVLAAEARLDALAGAGSVIRTCGEELWPDGTIATMYEFAHALHGDVLRSRMSAAGRRRGHHRIAERLRAAWSGREQEIAAELVFHFHAAGAPEVAVPYAELAASAATRLGAHVEAASFLEREIAALEKLPETPERRRSAIRMWMSLAQIRQAPDGFNAQLAEAAYMRALELADTLDDPTEAIVPTLALTSAHVAQGRLADAERDAERVAALVERFPSPLLEFYANVIVAQVRHHTAKLEEARRMLESALSYGGPFLPTYVNFRLHAFNYLGLTLVHLGYPDSARRRALEAMSIAKETGVPFDRANAAAFACFAAMTVRDRATLEVAGTEAETLGSEYGFGLAATIGSFTRGLLARMDGNLEDGIATMAGAIRAYVQNGNVLVVPGMMSIVADAHFASGHCDEALALVEEARSLMNRTGDARFHPEFLRIEAQATLLGGDAEKARTGFDEAIRAARSCGLRWQELRASLGLARLIRDENDVAGARRIVEPIVAATCEGHDLEDFREARAFLNGLASDREVR